MIACALAVLATLPDCYPQAPGSGLGSPVDAGSGGGFASGGADGGASLPANADPATLLPARIRRLTNAEYENSVRDVVGNTEPVATDFVPDSRQSGFTVNDAQRVDSVLVKQIAEAATTLAAQVRAQLSTPDTKAPCPDPSTQAEACATSFIQSFATRAFRRPLGDDEVQQLLTLYHAGADGAAYADGIELVATGVLQSAGFLYLTEVGTGAASGTVTLTPYEVASQMSYLLTAAPPTGALLKAAAEDALETPEQRLSAILQPDDDGQSLLQTDGARDRVVRIIREWLGTDQLEDTTKDSNVYADFASLKPAMVAEAGDFIAALDARAPGTRTLQQLLGADWTATTDGDLAALYDAPAPGTALNPVIQLPTRRGILNQGAFLSVYAHANETAPVLRGVALLQRVACQNVPSPSTLNITVVPLVPDPTKTMRERLSAHVSDPVCASCHASIDSFGLAFEIYNGEGKHQTEDNGQPIDSSVVIATGTDLDGSYQDSNELAVALSTSPTVRECFARNVFRASSGRSDDAVAPSEDAFVQYWQTLQAPLKDENRADIVDTVVSYVGSPAFNLRRPQ
jgi:hypothetical protein